MTKKLDLSIYCDDLIDELLIKYLFYDGKKELCGALGEDDNKTEEEVKQYLNRCKLDIIENLQNKGIQINDSDDFDDYINKIDLIKLTEKIKKYFNVPESTNETVTYNAKIDDLVKINNVKIKNGGKFEFKINGENVEFTLSQCTPRLEEKYNPHKFSKNVTDSKTSSSNSFSNTIDYNKDGYSGTLSKNGDAKVISGVYVHGEEAKVKDSKTTSLYEAPEIMEYNKEGYTGTLYKEGEPTVVSGTYIPSDSKYYSKTISSSSNSFNETLVTNEGEYSGTLTKDGSSYQTGSYTPGDSKFITEYKLTTIIIKDGTPVSYSPTIPPLFYYSKDGYCGNLKMIKLCGDKYEGDDAGNAVRDAKSGVFKVVYEYSGTVSKPTSDTRQYHQKYSGNIYKGSIDTRKWKHWYSGTVRKSSKDTRTWQQDYSGTIYSAGYDEIKYYKYDLEVDCEVTKKD